MTIQRLEVGPRMSQVVVHGNTVYLAGVVANNSKGAALGSNAWTATLQRRVRAASIPV